jgi:hypothetical protein
MAAADRMRAQLAQEDAALDWLINWAMAQDSDARDHYYHVTDGEAGTCGCRYQGEGTDD